MSLDAAMYSGPIAVTLVYVGLYYLFQLNVLRVKQMLLREYRARGEKFDRYFGNDRVMLAADRVQLNMLEHMPPFLVLFWLHALFVDPLSTTWAGGLYVAARAVYPFVLGSRLGRGVKNQIFLVTGIGYGTLGYFGYGLVRALL